MTAYTHRDLTPRLEAALRDLPVVVLSGARQVGKSTLLRDDSAFARRRYVTLDDFASFEAFRSDPQSAVAGEAPLTIDEVQRLPELFLAVKAAVDAARRPGRFLLSGSANLALLAGVSDSLAGRAVWFDLHGMSPRELSGRVGEKPFLVDFFDEPRVLAPKTAAIDLKEAVLRGGMPPVSLRTVSDPWIWFEGYEQTYLERDVRNLAQIGDLGAFRQVLRLAALRTGQLLNTSELARDARVDPATANRYVSVLEASYVVRRLHAWRGSRATRLVKSPKIYFADSGLAAWLTGVRDFPPDRPEPLWGPLLETWFASNLASVLQCHWPGAHAYYWAVQGRHEVDFVIEAGRDVLAIEVKAAARWDDRDLRGLRAFLEHTPNCRAAVLACTVPEVTPLGDRLWAIPIATALA